MSCTRTQGIIIHVNTKAGDHVSEKIIICGSGPASKEKLQPCLEDVDYIIAADGGYERLNEMGLKADLVCGDMDSIRSTPEDVKKINYPPEKDRSDMQLCLDYVFTNFTTISEIIVTGALSEERFDHSLANIFMFFQYNMNITVIAPHMKMYVINKSGGYNFRAQVGTTVSVLSTWGGEIFGEGLKYNLDGKLKHPSHGISNIATSEDIKICVDEGKWAIMFLDSVDN